MRKSQIFLLAGRSISVARWEILFCNLYCFLIEVVFCFYLLTINLFLNLRLWDQMAKYFQACDTLLPSLSRMAPTRRRWGTLRGTGQMILILLTMGTGLIFDRSRRLSSLAPSLDLSLTMLKVGTRSTLGMPLTAQCPTSSPWRTSQDPSGRSGPLH